MQLEGRYTQGTALFHASSYQGYTDGILQGRIDDRAKGNIGSVIYGLSNSFGDLVDFKERHIVAATDIEEHATGTTDTHQGCSCFMEDAAYIGEVHVNHTGYSDYLGDALHSVAQYIVSKLKCLGKTTIASCSGQQAIIGNSDQSVNL